MAQFIDNSNRQPELVSSSLQTLLIPSANFVAVLTELPAMTVQLVGDDGVVYGTFNLTTVGVEVKSGLLTALPARIRFLVTSPGRGRFSIRVVITL